jgi:small subunit ribosomal protein S9
MASTIFYGTGRRKEAIARVWLFENQKGMTINGHPSLEYLQSDLLQMMVDQPLKTSRLHEKFRVRVSAQGGGLSGQASAIRLGIARALVEYDQQLRPILRQGGFLTRDPREKERKKPGRRGARRSFQYTKR